MLGGGTSAFLRLGNHAAAEQAASYIGRQHKFLLSQLTATVGGQPDAHPQRHRRIRWRPQPRRGAVRSFTWDLATGPSGTSTSRNLPTGLSWADGANWSDAEATQRVYEYAVEPTALQQLPDSAPLLTVECDPELASMRAVSAGSASLLHRSARDDIAQLAPASPARWPDRPVRPSEPIYRLRRRGLAGRGDHRAAIVPDRSRLKLSRFSCQGIPYGATLAELSFPAIRLFWTLGQWGLDAG